MTDRELLESAARAAGLQGEIGGSDSRPLKPGGTPVFWVPMGPEDAYCWNPLRDDSDALRLAVKLGITLHSYPVHHQGAQVVAVAPARIEAREHAETHGDCLYAATRRAIVRAAAQAAKQEAQS